MSITLRVLIVEDSEDDTLVLLRQLRNGGYDPTYQQVDSAAAMQEALQGSSWDIIISDYNLPGFSAAGALQILQETGQDLPFIILSGVIGEDDAVAAMKAGAQDYIMKGDVARLIPAIDRELREAERRRERRQLEVQFLQSQKMESIGRLAGGVAHDFNNLLTSIMGHAQLGAMALPQQHFLHTHLDEIQRAAESASNLTRQLLAFSRRQVIEPKTINLNDLISNISKMLQRLIGEDVELVTLAKPDLGLVTVDPGQFEQVIMNLVVNARDAMPQGGRITIETANVTLKNAPSALHIPGLPPGPCVILSVADTGVGMTEEIKTKIFEPFFTTKEEGKGTGLGLATCYGIVKQSGGHIQVETAPGLGSTFAIYLSRAEGARVDEPQGPEKVRLVNVPGGNETVLLAEDEPLVRSLIASTLHDRGYHVLQACNGKEALEVAQKHSSQAIHLLLTDLVMPYMGGVELARQFKSLRPDTRVLFTSGYPDEALVYQNTPDPNIEFIQKPFGPGVLSRKVRDILDKELPVTPQPSLSP